MSEDKNKTSEEAVKLYEVSLHLLSSLDTDRVQAVFSDLIKDLEKNTQIISNKTPELMKLAYTMIKVIGTN